MEDFPKSFSFSIYFSFVMIEKDSLPVVRIVGGDVLTFISIGRAFGHAANDIRAFANDRTGGGRALFRGLTTHQADG